MFCVTRAASCSVSAPCPCERTHQLLAQFDIELGRDHAKKGQALWQAQPLEDNLCQYV